MLRLKCLFVLVLGVFAATSKLRAGEMLVPIELERSDFAALQPVPAQIQILAEDLPGADQRHAQFTALQAQRKQLGRYYLASRILELGLLAGFSIYALFNPDNLDKDPTSLGLFLSSMGFGNFGNYFQYKQGAVELRIANEFSDFLSRESAEDLKRFAKVAKWRGSLNALADETAVVVLFTNNPVAATASGLANVISNVLGFMKNYRDVKQTNRLMRFAFVLCASSRLPAILGSGLSMAAFLAGDAKVQAASRIAGSVGMVLFGSGAAIRLYEAG